MCRLLRVYYRVYFGLGSPATPLIIRVPFVLIFGFDKETPQIKRAKGYYSGT